MPMLMEQRHHQLDVTALLEPFHASDRTHLWLATLIPILQVAVLQQSDRVSSSAVEHTDRLGISVSFLVSAANDDCIPV